MAKLKIKLKLVRKVAPIKSKLKAESSTKMHDTLTSDVMVGFLQTMQAVRNVLKNG